MKSKSIIYVAILAQAPENSLFRNIGKYIKTKFVPSNLKHHLQDDINKQKGNYLPQNKLHFF